MASQKASSIKKRWPVRIHLIRKKLPYWLKYSPSNLICLQKVMSMSFAIP